MKKLLLLLAITCLGQAMAQMVNEAYQPGSFTRVGKMIKADNNFYFVTPSGGDAPSLYSYDKKGNFRFKKVKKAGTTELSDVIRTLDNKILIIGYTWQCDYISSATVFIIKTDTNGNNIFDNSITGLPNADKFIKQVVQSDDSSFYAFSNNYLLHYTKNGVLNNSKALTGVIPGSAMYIGDQKFVVSHTNKLAIMDTNCAVISQYSSVNNYIAPKRISNNSFVAIDQLGRLKSIGLNLQALDSSDLTQGANVKIKSFDISQDTIYAMGYNTVSQVPVYIKFDTNFVNVYQFTGLTKKVDPKSISVIGNNVAFVSQSSASLSVDNIFSAFTDFDKNGSFVYPDDIGIENVEVDSMSVTTGTMPGSNDIYYGGGYRLKVTLKNYGNTFINSCYINKFTGMPMYCYGTDFHQKYNNLSLAPGASTTIVLPYMGEMGPIGSSSVLVTKSFTINNVRLYTTVPNDKTDGAPENDSYIKNGIVLTNVGLNEISSDAGMSLYPNPFNDNIYITSQSTKPVKRAEVYDVSGKMVLSRQNENEKEMQLNTGTLQSGFYLIKLYNSKEQVRVFKVAKQ